MNPLPPLIPQDPNAISLIPQNRLIVRASVRRFLGIRRRVVCATIAKFSIVDNRLDVSFHCPGGYHLFCTKEKATRFLRRNISLPKEVGTAVIELRRMIKHKVKCQDCGTVDSFVSKVTFYGPHNRVLGPIKAPHPNWSMKCPYCNKDTVCKIETV